MSKSDDLTRAELAYLKANAPQLVRDYVTAEREPIGVRTSAYRKVAASARAERDALIELAALAVVKGKSTDEKLRQERDALAKQVEHLRATLAEPAMVVHSEPSR